MFVTHIRTIFTKIFEENFSKSSDLRSQTKKNFLPQNEEKSKKNQNFQNFKNHRICSECYSHMQKQVLIEICKENG